MNCNKMLIQTKSFVINVEQKQQKIIFQIIFQIIFIKLVLQQKSINCTLKIKRKENSLMSSPSPLLRNSQPSFKALKQVLVILGLVLPLVESSTHPKPIMRTHLRRQNIPRKDHFQNLKSTTYPLFASGTGYNGEWHAQPFPNSTVITKQYNYISETHGQISIEFVEGENNEYYMIYNLLNSNYLDQVLVESIYNLTNVTSVLAQNSSIVTTQNVEVAILDHLTQVKYFSSCQSTLKMQFINKTSGMPWNLRASDFKTLRVDMDMFSEGCSFSTKSSNDYSEYSILQPLIYVAATITIATVSVCFIFNLLTEANMFFLMNISPYCILFMIFWDMQNFLINLMLGIMFEIQYFEYLTLASICYFFMLIIKMRLAFTCFKLQNQNHPRIQDRSLRNPSMRFTITFMLGIMFSFVGSWFLVKYPWYCQYSVAYHAFPLIHIVSTVRSGSRRTFAYCYQIPLWFQTILVPLFLRGTKDNFVSLTPWPQLVYVLPGIPVFWIFLSWLQQVCGPRFFIPKMCIPGYYNYSFKVSKVPLSDEGELKDCPICFLKLSEDPCNEGSEESVKGDIIDKKEQKREKEPDYQAPVIQRPVPQEVQQPVAQQAQAQELTPAQIRELRLKRYAQATEPKQTQQQNIQQSIPEEIKIEDTIINEQKEKIVQLSSSLLEGQEEHQAIYEEESHQQQILIDEEKKELVGNEDNQHQNDQQNKDVRGSNNNTLNAQAKLKGLKCFKTPCNHYYHKYCLQQWMEQKMECPSCRKQLPPC